MASFTVPCPKSSPLLRSASALQSSTTTHKISFARFGVQSTKSTQAAGCKVQAKLNEVSAEKSSSSAASLSKDANGLAEKLKSPDAVPDASTISAFMAQVSDLVKLVDSKDIIELQMKQMGCELLIRKKEALEPPPVAPAASFAMPPNFQQMMAPPQPSPAAAAPAPTTSAPAAKAPAPAAPTKSSGFSHPPLKCPMAGTFYRSPGPGEPAFVKVGDKVQKGQVICIIEAMKLMNEIEADQSGTIAEILVDDGKPVSVDTPLFVIAP